MFRCMVAVTALALAACSGSTSKALDTKKAETAIAKGIQQQTGAVVRVICPKDVKIKSGKSFNCRAVPENQGALTVVVTMTDNKGNVRWRVAT